MITFTVAALTLCLRLEIPAQRLPSAIAAIGNTFGEKWSAAPALDRQCLLVHAPGASADEIKQKIAEACQATWSKNLLERSKEQQRSLSDQERARLLASVKATIEENAKEQPFVARDVNPNIKLIQEQMREHQLKGNVIMNLINMLPGGSYCRTAVHALNPADLCLPPGERIVFSSKPNKLQRQLPDKTGLLANYSRDLDKMRSYVTPVDRKERTENSMTVVPALETFSTREAVAKVCLSVFRNAASGTDSLTVNFTSVGASGRVLEASYLSLPLSYPGTVPERLSISTKSIPLSESDQALIASRRTPKMPPAEGNPAVDFVGTGAEPLAGLPSRLLEAIADAEGLKLVALLPDAALGVWMRLPAQAAIDVKTAVQAFNQTSSIEFTVKDGWLIVTPTYPLQAQSQFVDRASLRALLSSVERGDRCNGSDVATFFLANPQVKIWQPYTSLLTLFWGNPLDYTGATSETGWLRFYGKIASVFSQSPKGSIDLSGLTGEQVAALSAAILDGNAPGVSAGGDYASTEPTEVAANLRGGEIKWQTFDYGYLSFRAADSTPGEMNLHTFVELENGVGNDTQGVDASWGPRIKNHDYESVRAQKRHDLTIHVSFNGEELKYLRIVDVAKLGTPVKSIELLPVEVLTEIESLRKRFRPPPGETK